MQFRKHQLAQLRASWGPSSWFYQQLGEPARLIVGRAYGLHECSPAERSRSQEYISFALHLFAQKCGADKAHVVHALLTGSLPSLVEAIRRKEGVESSADDLAEQLQDSFREVTFGTPKA